MQQYPALIRTGLLFDTEPKATTENSQLIFFAIILRVLLARVLAQLTEGNAARTSQRIAGRQGKQVISLFRMKRTLQFCYTTPCLHSECLNAWYKETGLPITACKPYAIDITCATNKSSDKHVRE